MARIGVDVGAERLLQRLARHQRVVLLLVVGERDAIDEMRLHVGALDLHRRDHQALDRIGDVVRLVDHVGRIEVRRVRKLRVHQLVEDEEELVGIDGAGIEVVVAVFRIVEVEAAEFLELDQPRDDHLDVGVRRVVAEVDQAIRPAAERVGDQVVGAPVLHDGRIEGRLVELVLGEEPPVDRQRLVDFLQRFQIALEGAW